MLEEKILNTIKKYNMISESDRNILVAVSGGFDSTCLLYLLNSLKSELNINLYVAHINHCLRENAIIDENYVIDLGHKLDIPVFVKRFDINLISKNEKISTEMAGRKMRYGFFDEVAEINNCTKIALAHNANDNVETVLLNMFRGTGLNGLKGIKKVRDNKYIRPLIETTRDEINDYLNKNGIIARLDESNEGLEYRRNKIRNELIPYIKENFNENIIKTINRMSDMIVVEDEYINSIVEKVYNDVLIEINEKEVIINSKKMNEYEINIQKRLILKCIEKLKGNTAQIEEAHINDIIKMVNKNIGNKFSTPNKNMKVYINHGKIYFIRL